MKTKYSRGLKLNKFSFSKEGEEFYFTFSFSSFFSFTCKTILFNLSLNEAFQIGWERIFHNFTQRCSEFLPSLATLSRILELQVDSTERSRDQHSHNASLSRVKSNVFDISISTSNILLALLSLFREGRSKIPLPAKKFQYFTS